MKNFSASYFLNLQSSVDIVRCQLSEPDKEQRIDPFSTSAIPSYPQNYSTLSSTLLHYRLISDLETKPFLQSPPISQALPSIGFIGCHVFTKDIPNAQLVLNTSSSLHVLSYNNSTLSELFDSHAPVSSNSWFTFFLQVFKTLRRRLEHIYRRTIISSHIYNKGPH